MSWMHFLNLDKNKNDMTNAVNTVILSVCYLNHFVKKIVS